MSEAAGIYNLFGLQYLLLMLISSGRGLRGTIAATKLGHSTAENSCHIDPHRWAERQCQDFTSTQKIQQTHLQFLIANQARLESDAKSFDGLMSITPAKMYYGEDNSDQWKKKKQSKAEAKAARRGRLDPNSALNRNAKEVMDERAKKRKLEEMCDDDSSAPVDDVLDDDIEKEQPGEGLERHDDEAPSKKQKVSKAKRAKTAEKRIKTREKRAERRKAMEEADTEMPNGTSVSDAAEVTAEEAEEVGPGGKPQEEHKPVSVPDSTTAKKEKTKKEDKTVKKEKKPENSTNANEEESVVELQVKKNGNDDTAEELAKPTPQSSPDSGPVSPTFDRSPQPEAPEADQASAATSVNDGEVIKRKRIQLPTEEGKRVELHERLRAKLAKFKEARGAGPNGKPVRSREDLIEARRVEQAKKKERKREARQKEKEEEDRKREEALKAASVRSSPLGSMSPSIQDSAATNFSFGRVSFADGAQMSRDLSYVLKNDKRKGPSDPKTALAKLENQKAKFAALDEDKRKEVLEKETWLAARKRAEGDKTKDDETLLKKTIKRKEKAKKKSDKEWTERVKGVNHAKKIKQQKREDNLRKRREDKALGKMGKGKGAKKSSKGNKKVKARPGFEGAFSFGKK
ncbi:surfeit locus protein 6-domain-containing protein [Zalerion maritima]|uniref:Surfeit locus protein 6-domain-containing protein n=1 Tax=Zalerion maritima TaxID=339359 RepID=A0AAD5RIC9_9PEZI|nr:surfeit locus protein 6-domain-containing protein [Zalerion maritima]